MSRWRKGLIVSAVVIVAAALIFWPRAGGRQPLSFMVLSYGRNYWGDRPGLAFVLVAVTNSTKETLDLGSGGCSVLLKGKSGWKSPELVNFTFSSFQSIPPKLLPGEGFTFGVGIPSDTPCKVGVNYLNDRLSGRVWQKLPRWLARTLSWASPWRTATTEVIDLNRL